MGSLAYQVKERIATCQQDLDNWEEIAPPAKEDAQEVWEMVLHRTFGSKSPSLLQQIARLLKDALHDGRALANCSSFVGRQLYVLGLGGVWLARSMVVISHYLSSEVSTTCSPRTYASIIMA